MQATEELIKSVVEQVLHRMGTQGGRLRRR